MQIINGTNIAKNIIDSISTQVSDKTLAIILATNDTAAHTYVTMKKKKAEKLGINVVAVEFSMNSTTEELINQITKWNEQKEVDGILVQLPLFPHLNRYQILETISPYKDVDGLTSHSLGKVSILDPHAFISATVLGILESINVTTNQDISWDMLTSSKFDVTQNFYAGKLVTIVNNSTLIGIPCGNVLSACNATVTIANEHTTNLKELMQQADILVTATGKPEIFDYTFVKHGATVIDVTSVRTPEGVKGDFRVTREFEEKVAWYTPVPGGIGPLTIASLLQNLAHT